MSQFSTKSPRFAKLILFLAILVLIVVPIGTVYAQGPEPPTRTFEVDPRITAEFIAALTGLVVFGVTQGLKSLSALIAKSKWFRWINISGWGSIVTALIVDAILYYLGLGLALVPAGAEPAIPIVLLMLTSLLTAFGVHATAKMGTAEPKDPYAGALVGGPPKAAIRK